MNSGTEKKK